MEATNEALNRTAKKMAEREYFAITQRLNALEFDKRLEPTEKTAVKKYLELEQNMYWQIIKEGFIKQA